MAANEGASVRAEAARVVDAVASGGRSLDDALETARVFDKPENNALLRYLAYGAVRRHWRLSDWTSKLLQKPLRGRDSVVAALLRVGMFQIADSRVPDHAAVSQTVEAAKLLKRPRLAPLVNAVLRNFIRGNLPSTPAESREAAYDHPSWLIDTIRRDWPDAWKEILSENNRQAPMWLRVNARRGNADDYVHRLAAAGIDGAERVQGIDQAIRLKTPLPVASLPGFAEGDVSVQDAAAQIAGAWLADHKGVRFLDACAAPGGKTGHLLELIHDAADLTAIDRDAERLTKVRENLGRLGLAATVKVADASDPATWWDGRHFDRVLLDVPCSATGVIRRHPDIKLLREPGDIASLSATQHNMLSSLWSTLAPDGLLLYVTCSVLRSENDDVISAFLQQHDDVEEIITLPNNNIRVLMRRKTSGYQVLPGTAGLDGFYFALLHKRAA